MEKEITLYYQQFDTEDELPEEDRDLLNLAKGSMEFAYSPYSHLKVGSREYPTVPIFSLNFNRTSSYKKENSSK